MTPFGNPVYEQAREICGPPNSSSVWEDCMQEAVLAILEGRDPRAAVFDTKRETRHIYLRPNEDVTEDGRLVRGDD
jgi:hypothetical protein